MRFRIFAAALAIAFAGAAQAQTTQPQPADAAQPMRIIKKRPKKPDAKTAAATKTIEGTIKGFQCGDNCYLTIKTAKGAQTGLCEAKACVPWVENQKMPKSFIGKKVKIGAASGVQRDAAGTAMGKTTAFRTLDFVK